MPNMISLAQSWDEKYGSPETDEKEMFPEICLSGDQVKELGLASVPVGTVMVMTAHVVLEERNEEAVEGMRIEFEIREAAFEAKEKPKSAATILFPNG